ncbi:hypothetical protein [Tellurirhabdus bombi]|uniref:hypothetical protein n=1 Tax=Tellurirhabdus bombi TaxID=2907205 RepID=UPI001F169E09|nr:hypothetical protein [Tellurirhabdus bombi]
MINLYQQRDFSEKINVTFQYAIQEMRSLGMALLYIAGPLALASGIISGYLQATVTTGIQAGTRVTPFFGTTSSLMLVFLTYFLTLLTGLLVSLVVYAHLKIYDRTNGGPVTVSEVWEEIQASLGQSIGVGIVTLLLTILAFFVFFFPAIYLGVVFSLAIIIVVFERPGLGPTISRCFNLIRDKWWSTFGLLLIMGIIVYVISFIFNAPLIAFTLLKSFRVLSDIPEPFTILATIISTIGSSVMSALGALALAFQYFNLVERQEGRGLLSDIESIGSTPTKPRFDDEGDY